VRSGRKRRAPAIEQSRIIWKAALTSIPIVSLLILINFAFSGRTVCQPLNRLKHHGFMPPVHGKRCQAAQVQPQTSDQTAKIRHAKATKATAEIAGIAW